MVALRLGEVKALGLVVSRLGQLVVMQEVMAVVLQEAVDQDGATHGRAVEIRGVKGVDEGLVVVTKVETR